MSMKSDQSSFRLRTGLLLAGSAARRSPTGPPELPGNAGDGVPLPKAAGLSPRRFSDGGGKDLEPGRGLFDGAGDRLHAHLQGHRGPQPPDLRRLQDPGA